MYEILKDGDENNYVHGLNLMSKEDGSKERTKNGQGLRPTFGKQYTLVWVGRVYLFTTLLIYSISSILSGHGS